MPLTEKQKVNGHHGPFRTMERLAEAHEHSARVLREAMRLMAERATASSTLRTPAILANALGLDATRRATGVKEHKTKAAGYNGKANRLGRREKTAALLAKFDTAEPRSGEGLHGLGPLSRHGYLKRTKKGFVRTSKPFTAHE